MSAVRAWVSGLVAQAIRSCSTEQDRLNALAWLAAAREILRDEDGGRVGQMRRLYRATSFSGLARGMLNGAIEAVRNYKDSNLPLPVKLAVPVTMAAAAGVGGQAVGLAGFGSAIGAPVLLLVFLGVAGLTSVLEVFLGDAAARDYISAAMALIVRDEVYRRARKDLQEAMRAAPAAPWRQSMPEDEAALRAALLAMDPFDFERHVMAFFQAQGLLAWVTKKSNDAGIDGFVRHGNGLVVVQCKRHAAENPVGSPDVQKFKGAMEEHGVWRGYLVTTSFFSGPAMDSAFKNERLVCVGMDGLLAWHKEGVKF